MTPLVSIILTYYDYDQYLSDTVASLAAQTYKNFELIVVDDCGLRSRAKAILSSNLKLPFRIIEHERNLGLPAARNTGVRNSSGSFLVVLDSDDILEPTFIEETIETLDANGVDGIYTQVQAFGDQSFLWTPDCSLIELLAGIPCPATFLMKREVYDRAGGYKENLPLYSDHDFWIEAVSRGCTFVRLDKPLYNYRKHEHSLSFRNRHECWKAVPVLYEMHKKLYTAHAQEIIIAKEKHYRHLEEQYDHLYKEWVSVDEMHRMHEESRKLDELAMAQRNNRFGLARIRRAVQFLYRMLGANASSN